MLKSLKEIGILAPFEDQEIYNLLKMSRIRKYKAGECDLGAGPSQIHEAMVNDMIRLSEA